MVRIACIEYLSELKNSLRWWKVLLIVSITILMVFAYADVKKVNTVYVYWYWASFSLIRFLSPKVSKLNYLLPGDKKSRVVYLACSAVTVCCIISLWFCLIYIGNILLRNYGVLTALKDFFCESLLIAIWISGFAIGGNYPTSLVKKESKQDERTTKTKSHEAMVSTVGIILAMVPLLYVILSRYMTGFWYYTGAILSYFCYIPYFYSIKYMLQKFDTSYENIRKPVKLI